MQIEFRPDQSSEDKGRNPFYDLSLWILIGVNIVTIYQALTEHWSLLAIMFVYWAQSVIIGVFNVIRMLMLKNFSTGGLLMNGRPQSPVPSTKRSLALFFTIHYGFFHAGYLAFLLGGIFNDFNESFTTSILPITTFPIIYFLLNHAFSFFYNRANDESKRPNIATLMFTPYVRIIPMHLTIILGGAFVSSGKGSQALFIFLMLKLAADALLHIIEHSGKAQEVPA